MSERNRDDASKILDEDNSSPATKPSKPCVCPKCGTLLVNKMETPCYKRSCPKCDSKMLSM